MGVHLFPQGVRMGEREGSTPGTQIRGRGQGLYPEGLASQITSSAQLHRLSAPLGASDGSPSPPASGTAGNLAPRPQSKWVLARSLDSGEEGRGLACLPERV